MPEDLPADYYLHNFHYLIDFVSERYWDLFADEERTLVDRFRAQTTDAQKLFVRLCSRKGPLFRTDKLSYEEISDLPRALAALTRAELVQDATEETVESLHLMSKEELIRLLPETVPSGIRRQELISLWIARLDQDPGCLKPPGQIVRLGFQEQMRVLRLFFFGNLHQDMTEFVLHELGVTRYEDYPIEEKSRFFDSRDAVRESIALYHLGELGSAVLESENTGDLAQFALQLEASCPDTPMLKHRYDRIVNRVARQLERVELPEKALRLYNRSDSVPARERTARILSKLGRSDQATVVCRRIVNEPLDEAEREFGVRFLSKLQPGDEKACAELAQLRLSLEPEQLTIPLNSESGVELSVCHWAEQSGYSAFYVENGLFPGLFGLAFWDVIFAPLPGAFFNPFQKGPVDLFTPEFTRQRWKALETRFMEFRQSELLWTQILENYESKQGVANRFVHWSVLTEELLQMTREKVRVSHLVAIFQRLLGDLRNNRTGFPDLILFDDEGYRLWEVKAPGDRLQTNQRRWFRFFESRGIPASVVNVSYQ